MTDKYILIDGEPVPEPDLFKWAQWFETAGNRVAYTDVAPGVYVSTVFLGIDHRFGPGRPVLFETMIFGGDRDQEGQRYCTRADAIAGHEAIVKEFADAARVAEIARSN